MHAHDNLTAAGEVLAVTALPAHNPLDTAAGTCGDADAADMLLARVAVDPSAVHKTEVRHVAWSLGHNVWQAFCVMGWQQAASVGVVTPVPEILRPAPGRHRKAGRAARRAARKAG